VCNAPTKKYGWTYYEFRKNITVNTLIKSLKTCNTMAQPRVGSVEPPRLGETKIHFKKCVYVCVYIYIYIYIYIYMQNVLCCVIKHIM